MKRRKIRIGLRRKKRSARYKLNIFWFKKNEKFSIDNLISIANPVYTNDFKIRKRSLRLFLERGDKSFDDFNRMLNATRGILKKDGLLKQKFWDQFLSAHNTRNVDYFAELIYANEDMATERFGQEVKDGTIAPKQAKRVWAVLFIKFTDEKSRKNIWKEFKALNPDSQEIQRLFDMDENQAIMRSLPRIAAEARKILKRNKKIEDKRKKLLGELIKLIDAAMKEERAKQKQE